MNSESLQEKQAILRKEVIEGGLDAEAFMEYMATIKNQGQNIDLQNWTITQLKKVISQFRQQNLKNIQELINSRMMRQIKKTKIFQSKKQQVKYEGTNLWDFQINEQQQCSTSEVQFKFKPNSTPCIKIEKFEIKSVGGFIFGIGARNQLQLVISTNFTQHNIVRKGQDCSWLKAILTLKHPGCFVPPLQEERELSSDDTKGIKNRISQIQLFLNNLLKYRFFINCQYFKQFLEQTNSKRFHQFKNRELSFAAQKDIDLIETPTGKFHIEISEKMNRTVKQTSQIVNDFNSIYNDYNNCFSRIITDMENLNRNTKQLRDITAKASEKYGKIKDTLKIKDLKIDNFTLAMNNTIETINRNLKRHIKALADFYDGFIKNTARDWKQMLNYDRRQQNQVKNYLNKKQQLLRKKEKHMNDPNKWQLPEADLIAINKKGIGKMTKGQIFEKMFPSDNENQNRQRILLSFVNQNYLQSIKVFVLQQQRDLINNYLKYSGNHMCASQQVQNSFKELNQILTA